jgi:hypothetical protein
VAARVYQRNLQNSQDSRTDPGWEVTRVLLGVVAAAAAVARLERPTATGCIRCVVEDSNRGSEKWYSKTCVLVVRGE